ncbi:hypothetical protein IFR04_016247 [Cadophora malorum]|uniref:Uncharacterized protein n=1 Tax=Cadophora malorum TaxID=108018 RepID=A0A8H7T1B8_9HELO|nr:hypothetical protein IFR04_016247 [Cadophora malorum]
MIVEVDLTVVVVTAVLVDVAEHVPVVIVMIDVEKIMLVGAQVQMLVIDEVARDVMEERASAVDVPLWDDNVDANEEACERVDDSREAEDSELVEDRKEVELNRELEDCNELEARKEVELSSRLEDCSVVEGRRGLEDSKEVEDSNEPEASEDVGRSENAGKLELEKAVEGIDSDKV